MPSRRRLIRLHTISNKVSKLLHRNKQARCAYQQLPSPLSSPATTSDPPPHITPTQKPSDSDAADLFSHAAETPHPVAEDIPPSSFTDEPLVPRRHSYPGHLTPNVMRKATFNLRDRLDIQAQEYQDLRQHTVEQEARLNSTDQAYQRLRQYTLQLEARGATTAHLLHGLQLEHEDVRQQLRAALRQTHDLEDVIGRLVKEGAKLRRVIEGLEGSRWLSRRKLKVRVGEVTGRLFEARAEVGERDREIGEMREELWAAMHGGSA